MSFGFGSTARADTPSSQGWWTSANPGSVGGVGAPAATPAPPDVPSNGLFIEGGPTSSAGAGNAGAIAYAALTYDLPAGATVGKLTLTVAPNSATTPSTTLELCALTIQSFQSEEGGPMSDAPSYNCTNNVTAAQASNAYQFNVSPLVSSGALSFAILPTSPTDRVVLAQPDAQSLPVQASSDTTVASPIDTGSSSGTFGSTAGTDTGSSTGAGSAPVDTSGATPVPTGVAATPVPSAPLSPSLAQPRTTTNPSTPSANAALVSPATSSAGPKPWVGVIFLVVLLLAAALWMGAGRSASAEQPAASD
ncbi:MAG TPA: hypothetical protein VFV02_16500 [Acidimicrobiales bacterium]|nr:hypothetical protein [Acidimicrobiales bacterium]